MSYLTGVVLVTALVTYLVRMLPIVFFKHELTSKWVKAFMYYIPYAVLGAMTFPAILYSTRSMISASAGLIAAIILAYWNKGLLTTALGAAGAVYIAEYFIL
ncbi:MAG: AzlD domain-containing protein [Candidatus Riflebacteria bacterium]|nr:AzlD domain-containing protein [Candidatus Riflebacteria bacterium]